jgi:hypothetical protein
MAKRELGWHYCRWMDAVPVQDLVACQHSIGKLLSQNTVLTVSVHVDVGDVLIYLSMITTTTNTTTTPTVVWSSSSSTTLYAESSAIIVISICFSRRKETKLDWVRYLQKQEESPLLFSQRDLCVAEDLVPKGLPRSRRT